MKHIPWEEVRRRYEQEEISCRELAAAFGVCAKSVQVHAKNEGWQRGQRTPRTADGCLTSAVRQLAGLLHRAESGEKVNMTEVKELTAVLKELVRLRELMDPKKDGGVLEVVMGQEVESWSR